MSGRLASLKKAFVVSQGVRSVVEALEQRQLLSAAITLVNPDLLPSSDRLIFNTIQNLDPTVPNVVHNTNPLKIENTGDATLTLTSLTISGPWAFVNAPAGNYAGTTIAPGGSLTITLQFTQASLPAHSGNQTNDTTQPTGGAAVTGALTINSNDPTTPTKTVTLAGYWQNQSADEEEPNIMTIANTLAGYDTVIATSAQLAASNGVDLQNSGATPTYYGQEVVSSSWVAATPSQPVSIQELAQFEVEGVSDSTFWYSASTLNAHLLLNSAANQGQTLLPTLSNGSPMTASFSPSGAFGFRVDNHYSDDAVNIANGDSTDDGHRFRFYPVIDENGNAVPNTWLVAVHNGDLIPDYQDAVYIVSNMMPAPAAQTPPAPTNLTATSVANPVLNWTGVTYTNLAGYNVYRSTSPNGTFTKLTSSPTLLTTFTDNVSPPAGVALYYRVTAVDSISGNESAPATTTANTPGGPIAGSFTVSAFTNTALVISVLNHVTDSTGTPTAGSLLVTSGPTSGTATVDTTNGLITYTSNTSFAGTDVIHYSISDNNSAGPSTGIITINVANPAVTPPIVLAQSGTTLANTPVTVTPVATDFTGNAITPTLVEIGNASADFSGSLLQTLTTAAGGTVVLNLNNSVTYTPATNFVGGDSFLFKVEDSHGNLSSQETFTINVGAEISSAKGGNKSIVYPDKGGQSVTVTLNKGVADVFYSGTGTESTAKGKVTVTGSNLAITNVNLIGTTAASTLALKTKHNAGSITLGGVTDTGSLGSISAVSANLAGVAGTHTIVVGGVKSINLKSINNAQILIGSAGPSTTSLSAGAVVDSFLTSNVTISSLKATSWTNVTPDLSTQAISAPALKSLNITGEFDANLDLTGTGNDLNSAHVGGVVNIGLWNIAGSTGTMTVGSTGSAWGGVTAGAKVGGLTIKSGNLAADITAGSIGSLTVHGNISGSDIVTTGNIQSVTAATITDSLISAGAGAGASFATTSLANIGTSVIHSISITSKTVTGFSNDVIAADEVFSALLGIVSTSNGGNPEGLIGVTFKSVSGEIDGKKGVLGKSQLSSDSALAAFYASKGINPGDFQIDIL